MPEAGRDGSSSSKRPRLAFEDPMDVEAARLDPLYAQWKVWFETCAPIATAFLAPEAKAAEALGYRERATRKGLAEAGMQEMVHWAAPHKPDHEVLVALAAYEKAKPYKVDLLQGKWVRRRNHRKDSHKNSRKQRQKWTPCRRKLQTWKPSLPNSACLRSPRARKSSSRPSVTKRCRPGWREIWWRHCRPMGRHRWRGPKMRPKQEKYYTRRYGQPCTRR